jgi:hypothetical protein
MKKLGIILIVLFVGGGFYFASTKIDPSKVGTDNVVPYGESYGEVKINEVKTDQICWKASDGTVYSGSSSGEKFIPCQQVYYTIHGVEKPMFLTYIEGKLTPDELAKAVKEVAKKEVQKIEAAKTKKDQDEAYQKQVEKTLKK